MKALSLSFAFTIALALVTIFVSPARSGFEPGKHGNTTASLLSSMENASSDNYFLGYYARIQDKTGKLTTLFYDRRPPPFFMVARPIILAGHPSSSSKIRRSQFLMNFIFALTCGVVFYTLIKSFTPGRSALAAILLVASGPYVNYYKDMFDVDMPAILGIVLLWAAIWRFLDSGKRGAVYIATCFAASFGLGYAVFGVSLSWLLVRFSWKLMDKGFRRVLITEIFLDVSFRSLLVCIVTSMFWIGYGAGVQIHADHTPWLQTSIIDSLIRRLLGDPTIPPELIHWTDWPIFLQLLVCRFVFGLMPFPMTPFEIFGNIPLSLALMLLCDFTLILLGICLFKFLKSMPPQVRELYLTIALSGPVWLMIVRHATAFHDYFSLYYLGTWIVCVLALIHRYAPTSRLWVLFFSIALFALVNTWRYNDVNSKMKEWAQYTSDAESISPHIALGAYYETDPRWESIVPGIKYALPFYFPNRFISLASGSNFVVTNNPKESETNLTPDNHKLFLVSRNK